MIRITSLNLNGIRSAFTKGLEAWLDTHRPDIVCLQETKAHLQDIKDEIQHPLDYTGHFCSAEKKRLQRGGHLPQGTSRTCGDRHGV